MPQHGNAQAADLGVAAQSLAGERPQFNPPERKALEAVEPPLCTPARFDELLQTVERTVRRRRRAAQAAQRRAKREGLA